MNGPDGVVLGERKQRLRARQEVIVLWDENVFGSQTEDFDKQEEMGTEGYCYLGGKKCASGCLCLAGPAKCGSFFLFDGVCGGVDHWRLAGGGKELGILLSAGKKGLWRLFGHTLHTLLQSCA